MNTQKAIEAFLSKFKSETTESNVYVPNKKESSSNRFICVQSSINEGSGNFNETFQHIHEQLKPKK